MIAVRLHSWIALFTFGWILVLSEVSMAQLASSQIVVQLYDREDYRGQISLRLSNDISTSFELKGTDGMLVSSPIQLPADIGEFQIQGTLAWKHHRAGDQKSSGSSSRRFVDFTPAIRPLRSQESWGKRMESFVKELVRLEKMHEDRTDSPSEWIMSNGSVQASEIIDAEKRLKFALPSEHKQLLQDYGAWSYSDSFCVSIEDMEPAEKQMISIWGSPASEFASLSTKSKELYRASVMLFVEAGDGYGALLYHPTSSGGEYYWIHQDDLDQPAKLVDHQDQPRDYSSAMRWLIANQILMYYDDAFPDFCFLDRSSSTALTYQLILDFPEPKKLDARLDVEWTKFE